MDDGLMPLTEEELAGIEKLASRGSIPMTPYGALRLIAELRALRAENEELKRKAGNGGFAAA